MERNGEMAASSCVQVELNPSFVWWQKLQTHEEDYYVDTIKVAVQAEIDFNLVKHGSQMGELRRHMKQVRQIVWALVLYTTILFTAGLTKTIHAAEASSIHRQHV